MSKSWSTHPRAYIRVLVATAGCLTTWGLASDSLAASNKVSAEAVTDYTFTSGGSTANNTDAVTEANGFWSTMTATGTGFAGYTYFKNDDVWASDFYDRQLSGGFSDNDAPSDPAGNMLTWVVLHGACDDVNLVTSCTTDANCPAGSYCPGGTPLSASYTRRCIPQTRRKHLTSSTSNARSNIALYGADYGGSNVLSSAYGESSNSGSWGGAGTNGGTNVIAITNSCGFRSRYMDAETPTQFAGVHSMLISVPTNVANIVGTLSGVTFSDTSQWSSRGSTFATAILANTLAQVGDAWMNPTMVSNGFLSVGGAPGEGAQVILSKDVTSSQVNWRVSTESWLGAQQDTNDALGRGWVSARYVCNYNCSLYGW